MSDSNMLTHEELTNSYYNRDIEYNINNNNTIIRSLSKLGYLNFNLNDEIRNVEQRMLKKYIDNNYQHVYNQSVSNIINMIKQTDEYTNYMNQLNGKLGRSIILSRFINDFDTNNFYKSLTVAELEYIGF